MVRQYCRFSFARRRGTGICEYTALKRDHSLGLVMYSRARANPYPYSLVCASEPQLLKLMRDMYNPFRVTESGVRRTKAHLT
jgi:hypothetical protein